MPRDVEQIQLLHQFLQGCNKLIDCLIFAGTDITCDAGADMVRKKLFVKGIHSRIDSCGLDQDVVTISVIFQHSYNSPNLPLDTLQAVDELLAVGFRTVGVLRTTAGTDRSLRSGAIATTGFFLSGWIILYDLGGSIKIIITHGEHFLSLYGEWLRSKSLGIEEFREFEVDLCALFIYRIYPVGVC